MFGFGNGSKESNGHKDSDTSSQSQQKAPESASSMQNQSVKIENIIKTVEKIKRETDCASKVDKINGEFQRDLEYLVSYEDLNRFNNMLKGMSLEKDVDLKIKYEPYKPDTELEDIANKMKMLIELSESEKERKKERKKEFDTAAMHWLKGKEDIIHEVWARSHNPIEAVRYVNRQRIEIKLSEVYDGIKELVSKLEKVWAKKDGDYISGITELDRQVLDAIQGEVEKKLLEVKGSILGKCISEYMKIAPPGIETRLRTFKAVVQESASITHTTGINVLITNDLSCNRALAQLKKDWVEEKTDPEAKEKTSTETEEKTDRGIQVTRWNIKKAESVLFTTQQIITLIKSKM